MIKILVMDIDGVLTNGKSYISNNGEFKTICYHDLDAINDIRNEEIRIAVVTGEENEFTNYIKKRIKPDFFYSGCKNKVETINDISRISGVEPEEICYIGDGKYDISAIEKVGLSMCPADAISQVRELADIILNCNGGDGCIAEAYDILKKETHIAEDNFIRERFIEHKKILNNIIYDEKYIVRLLQISDMIVNCYKNHNKLLLCGNGGSAADAQHLSAELVSRFYKERKALSAEALNANTSIITAIGNDYDYVRIFARSIEAQGREGDVLIGISTSGKSKNIIEAFKTAKNINMITVLFTGNLDETAEILEYTDYLLKVPSNDTPRIQEIHILSGHVMCEMIENKMCESVESEESTDV